MKTKKNKPSRIAALRQRAEHRLRNRKPKAPPSKEQDVTLRLIHELQVHQVELEMQNDNLAAAQAEVEAGMELYADLYDFAPVGYLTLDRHGTILHANIMGAKLLGVPRARLLQHKLRQFIAPEAKELCDGYLQILLQSNAKQQCELTLKREDGSDIHVRLDSVRVDLHGRDQPRGVSHPEIRVAMSDITELKQIEADLCELNAKLEQRVAERTAELTAASQYARKLIETSLDPQVTIGRNGKITDVNAATEQATGFARNELIGTDFCDYFTEPDKALAGYRQMFREGSVRDYALQLRHRDGHSTAVLYNAAVYRDDSGHPIGAFAAARDITELVKAERALREANETLEDRVAKRTAELARSNEDLQQFANAVSHDLQEPLRMIGAFLTLLKDRYASQLDDKAEKYIGYAVEGATRMSQLIRDLLEYSRVSHDRSDSRIDAGKALADALANLRNSIQESGASVTRDALPIVYGDAVQLLQLFQNLIGNAIKFRHADRPCRIHVGIANQDDLWTFSVSDNGIGIPPEHLERVFAIFHRLHSRERYPGSGIGLSICRKIVERHGGRIWVESEADKGTTFRFTWPRTQGE